MENTEHEVNIEDQINIISEIISSSSSSTTTLNQNQSQNKENKEDKRDLFENNNQTNNNCEDIEVNELRNIMTCKWLVICTCCLFVSLHFNVTQGITVGRKEINMGNLSERHLNKLAN